MITLFRYKWGVGLSTGVDNIVPFRNKTFSRDIKESCAELQLQHNTTYYSTIIAKNSALNPRTVKGYSNGGKMFIFFSVDKKNPYIELMYIKSYLYHG